MNFRKRLQTAMSPARTIARLVTAWLTVVVTLLLTCDSFTRASDLANVSLLRCGLAFLAFFAIYSAFAVLLPLQNTDSRFMMIATAICAVRWLTVSQFSGNRILFSLAVGIVVCMVSLYFVRENTALIDQCKPNKCARILCVALFGIGTCTVIATITCLRFKTFSSPNFDFGIFCNMFYNMKKTGLPTVSCERDQLLSHFAVHISPVYYLLLPLYFLFPYAETLQIGQALFLAAGIIPLYLLARHFKLSGPSTIALCLLYAVYPALSSGCFYDLHENCFLPFFLLWTFWFFEKNLPVPMFLSAACVLMIKEDCAVYLAFFALYVLVSRKKYLSGALLLSMAIAYFLLATRYLADYGDGVMINRFENLIADEKEGLFGAVRTILLNPGFALTQLFTAQNASWNKIAYLIQLLLPLGFLPFCTKKCSRWLLAAPLLINLLTLYQYQYDIGFQYHFGILAFLFYATVQNLPLLTQPVRRTLLTIALAFGCCLYVGTVIPRLNTYLNRFDTAKDTYRAMDELLDTSIPPDASVAASSFLIPHLYERDEIYEVAYHKKKKDVEYVALDMRYEESDHYLEFYTRNDAYQAVAEGYNLIILKRNPNPPNLPNASNNSEQKFPWFKK